MLVGEEEIKSRWREYFSELLNRPEPASPIEEEEVNEVEVEDIKEEELRKTIKS